MAIEQPQTSSAEPQTTSDVTVSESSSAEPDSQSSKAPGWWSKLFHRRGDAEETGPQGEDSATGSEPSGAAHSQEELERRVQAEADRREFQRQRAEKEKAKRELRD